MSELQKLNGMNTNNKNISPAKSQKDSPIRFDEAKQLSQAHGARVWGKSIELMLQEGITAVEIVALGPFTLIADIIAMSLSAVQGKLTLAEVENKIQKESIDKIADKTKLSPDKIRILKTALKSLNWISILKDSYLSIMLDQNKMTEAEYQTFINNNPNNSIDQNLTKIYDHMAIDWDTLEGGSSLLSIIDSSVVITEDMLRGLVEGGQQIDKQINKHIFNLDFQEIIHLFSNMFGLAKNTSTTSTLAQADDINYTPQYDLPLELESLPLRLLGDNKATTCQPSLIGKIGNGLNKVNPLAILKAKKEQALEKQRLAYAKSMKEYKAHIQRSIDRDPSMEYFYSSKYQDEHQNMFGTISCSNINPSEAHNFSSPVGGSFTSPFSSLSNEIAPFKIPPFLTIDDILKNPKFKEFAQNIAGNETHKQLCSYDRELHESFQDESPLSDEDRSTMEDAHDLIAYINRVGSEVERANELEQERRAKNPVV